MKLENFRLRQSDPQRPSGTCEADGRPVFVFFDRSSPGPAWITVRADMEEGAPLPAALAGVRTLTIHGRSVAVQALQLECEAGALQGSIDPELVDAVLDSAPKPDAGAADPGPGPAQRQGRIEGQAQSQDQAGGPGPTPAAQTPPPGAALASPLIAKMDDFRRCKAQEAETEERAAALKRAVRNAEQELEDLREDHASVETLLKAQRAETVQTGRQIREILDREGI